MVVKTDAATVPTEDVVHWDNSEEGECSIKRSAHIISEKGTALGATAEAASSGKQTKTEEYELRVLVPETGPSAGVHRRPSESIETSAGTPFTSKSMEVSVTALLMDWASLGGPLLKRERK